jgi:gamma-glutamylcyclotransferase (GGCT)/AIG2-like uncharacterized protein YtfP
VDELLAAYGTLQRRFGLHERLGVAGALRYVGPCRLRGQLYDLGAYPGLRCDPEPPPGPVHAELFAVVDAAALALLDRYEEYEPHRPVSSPFLRVRRHLDEPDAAAWVYLYNRSTAGRRRRSDGRW